MNAMHGFRLRLTLSGLLFGVEFGVCPLLVSSDEVLLTAALRSIGDLIFLEEPHCSLSAALVDKVRGIEFQPKKQMYYAAWVGTIGSLMDGSGRAELGDPRQQRIHDSVGDICDTIEWFRGWRRQRQPRVLYEGLWALRQIFSGARSFGSHSKRIVAIAREATKDLKSRE